MSIYMFSHVLPEVPQGGLKPGYACIAVRLQGYIHTGDIRDHSENNTGGVEAFRFSPVKSGSPFLRGLTETACPPCED